MYTLKCILKYTEKISLKTKQPFN